MTKEHGRSAADAASGCQPSASAAEEASSLSGIPNAGASPYSFCWDEPGSLEDRSLNLARSMAAVKCRNKYPVGVIGAEARAHYSEARNIASAYATRQSRKGAA